MPIVNADTSRLFVEASLKVAMGGGGRFQPTGFPDLGPALYKGADGKTWLLVESPQSMANRMERVCWTDGGDEADRVGRYNGDCTGIPYVLAEDTNKRPLTASPLEAHRLASPYIWDTQPFSKNGKQLTLPDYLKETFKLAENRLVLWKQVALGLLEIDPACLLHGVWFSDGAFGGGKVRITRALSGYIEAEDPAPANYGFQKRDPVSDRTDTESGQTAAEGFGSVIGPKQHFTSPKVKAYFQIDVERLRSYGLSEDSVEALVAWAIYKIRRVLTASRDGLADLRTECKFEAPEEDLRAWVVRTNNPKRERWELPEVNGDLMKALKHLKREENPILRVRWVPKIEGKAELSEKLEIKLGGLSDRANVRLEAKSKKDKTKVRRLYLYGEWSTTDKARLRELNPTAEALKAVDAAIKSYEKAWEKKAQGVKGEEDEADGADSEVLAR